MDVKQCRDGLDLDNHQIFNDKIEAIPGVEDDALVSFPVKSTL